MSIYNIFDNIIHKNASDIIFSYMTFKCYSYIRVEILSFCGVVLETRSGYLILPEVPYSFLDENGNVDLIKINKNIEELLPFDPENQYNVNWLEEYTNIKCKKR